MSRLTAAQMHAPDLNKKSKFKGFRGVGKSLKGNKHPWRETPARLLRAKKKREEPAIKIARPDRAEREARKERKREKRNAD